MAASRAGARISDARSTRYACRPPIAEESSCPAVVQSRAPALTVALAAVAAAIALVSPVVAQGGGSSGPTYRVAVAPTALAAGTSTTSTFTLTQLVGDDSVAQQGARLGPDHAAGRLHAHRRDGRARLLRPSGHDRGGRGDCRRPRPRSRRADRHGHPAGADPVWRGGCGEVDCRGPLHRRVQQQLRHDARPGSGQHVDGAGRRLQPRLRSAARSGSRRQGHHEPGGEPGRRRPSAFSCVTATATRQRRPASRSACRSPPGPALPAPARRDDLQRHRGERAGRIRTDDRPCRAHVQAARHRPVPASRRRPRPHSTSATSRRCARALALHRPRRARRVRP